MKKNQIPHFSLIAAVAVALFTIFGLTSSVKAQTTEFTYQGQIENSSVLANEDYDFQFALFDSLTGGTQLGPTITLNNIAVVDGVFSVKLDFGDVFNGNRRYLEISVRPSSPGSFTTLTPRQLFTSAPYSVRALKSTAADSLSSDCVGCITDAQIASVDGGKVTGTVANAQQLGGNPASSFIRDTDPRLSSPMNFIQNGNALQANSNFNIDGFGTANVFNARVQYNLGGNRILSSPGPSNIFVGVGAGASNSGDNSNSFVGNNAGFRNTTGVNNSFFGGFSGDQNITGNFNSFFGSSAGKKNTTGSFNSFFGAFTGDSNTGSGNAFFGSFSGFKNTTGANNSFSGADAGKENTTGNENAFFGTSAGRSNTTGNENAFFGAFSGNANTTGINNAFFGRGSGRANTTGTGNSYFGWNAGFNSTTGSDNAFFGRDSGVFNTTGSSNAFFGMDSGKSNTTGIQNSIFGRSAGISNTTGFDNAFFGFVAGFGNTTGKQNAFFGAGSGQNNSSGNTNVFLGVGAGFFNTTGNNNTFVGTFTGGQPAVSGNNNSLLGFGANIGSNNLSYASAIGSDAFVNSSNTVVIGRGADTVDIPGRFIVRTLGATGGQALCRNVQNQIALCTGAIAEDTDLNQLQIENRQKQLEEQIQINKQQQEKLDRQDAELKALKLFVCSQNPTAQFCQLKEK